MTIKKICVVTGTRAEYGLLRRLMQKIQQTPDLELQLIATAMHLSPEFGLTYQAIEEDGFHIDEKVEMLVSGDTPSAISKSMGLGIIGFSDTYQRLKPDAILLLGDRFEALAAAQTAMLARIPIIHLHGGEATEGLIDEAIRHAITKMSHLHFVATEQYRQRVIQLGEDPDRVFNVGALGVENVKRTQLLSKKALENSLKFKFGEINFLVTYHPVTLSTRPAEEAMRELLAALSCFASAKIIFTYPNADPSGRSLIKLIEEYADKHQGRVHVTPSLGQTRYLSALSYVDAVIGNSSSGIIEVPSFHKPTVNIGMRQQGRTQANSVIQCTDDRQSIESAIKKALSNDFLDDIRGTVNPYDNGCTSIKIANKIKDTDFRDLLVKRFYDVKSAV